MSVGILLIAAKLKRSGVLYFEWCRPGEVYNLQN
ncbi:MAG: hypothetical protein GAK29_04387 [Acinetobacter bereziniae]|uniref:Uncharacterized protein n=1 Tax=Acinetobacter bereziniae TaxID=106648 RepID=A0A833PBB8_ACIBZ|nr:MAG: hypothetical protein GAK29_04387 [Acinetobacter bereziniae]